LQDEPPAEVPPVFVRWIGAVCMPLRTPQKLRIRSAKTFALLLEEEKRPFYPVRPFFRNTPHNVEQN